MEILLFSNIQMAQFRCVLLSISLLSALKFFPWMFSLVLCACLLILFIARTNDESKSLIIGLGEFSSIHFVYDVVGWMSKTLFLNYCKGRSNSVFSMRAYVLPPMNYFALSLSYLFAGERKFFIHVNGSILVLFFEGFRKNLEFIAIAFSSELETSKNTRKDCKKLHNQLRVNGRP